MSKAIGDDFFSGVKSFFTAEFIGKVSLLTGLAPDEVRGNLNEVSAHLSRGLIHKAADPAGARELIHIIKIDGYDQGVPQNFMDRFRGEEETNQSLQMALQKGNDLLTMIFGERLGEFEPPSTKLMALITPLFMGILGSKVRQLGYNGAALTALFEKPHPAAQVGSMREPVIRAPETVDISTDTYKERVRERAHPSVVPIVISSIIILIALLFLKTWKRPEINPATSPREQAGQLANPPTSQAPSQTNFQAQTAPPRRPSLNSAKKPDEQLNAAKDQAKDAEESAKNVSDSIDPVAAALQNDSNATLPKRISLSDLRFDSGTANLTEDSSPTLNKLAADLKAHPNAKIRLEGNTDNIGSSQDNQKLSLARAEAIRNGLVNRGVKPSQVETTGLGSSNPVASNQTQTGRDFNRRTDIVIVSR